MKIKLPAWLRRGEKSSLLIIFLIIFLCLVVSSVTVALIIAARNSVPKAPVTSAITSHAKPVKRPDGGNGSAVSGSPSSATKAEILSRLSAQQVKVTDKIGSFVSFSSGKEGTTGSWIVSNVKRNTVIMQAEVYLNGHLIAETPVIHPGQHISSVSLKKDIAPGRQKVTAFVNYYTNDNAETFISKAAYQIYMTVT